MDEPASLSEIITSHLGPDAAKLPIVGTTWPPYEHVNVQLGLEHWLATAGRSYETVGIAQYQHHSASIGDLLQPVEYGPRSGSVAMVQLAIGPNGEVHDCVRCALFLVEDAEGRSVILLREGQAHGPGGANVLLEVIATDRQIADRTLRGVAELALEHNVFRGQVVSFETEMFGPRNTTLKLLARPNVARSDLVLPDGTLELIERQVVEVARHRDRLRDAGQHLKRGLLLHGPPGTGKTHTVRYLLGQLEGVTVVVLSGKALAAVGQACSIARSLQPSAVVVEDVDLIAEERGARPGPHPLLFELLNEMDGLGEDTDVVFLLTTNRADLLEPALASRPGRVDQAVEIPLPDAHARRELIGLYGRNLRLGLSDDAVVIERTEGMTASFLKEMLRRASMVAAIEEGPSADGQLVIEEWQLYQALDELLDASNQLTRSLLGAADRDS
jgi:ATP-dependent 26S proteasome regulatory subunit